MTSEGRRPVLLTIPAEARMLRFARVTAATLAADLSFTLEEIEDLRVAVDELAAAAIEGCDPSSLLELSFEVDGSDVVVEGSIIDSGDVPELHPVARELLELLADGYEFTGVDGTRRFRLTKRRRAAA